MDGNGYLMLQLNYRQHMIRCARAYDQGIWEGALIALGLAAITFSILYIVLQTLVLNSWLISYTTILYSIYIVLALIALTMTIMQTFIRLSQFNQYPM